MTQLCTGLKLGEACRLRVGDVYASGRVASFIEVERHRKLGPGLHRIDIPARLSEALLELLDEHRRAGRLEPDRYLFPSRKGRNRPITPGHAAHLYREVYKALGIWSPWRVATNSTRKTFAGRRHRKNGYNATETARDLGLTVCGVGTSLRGERP